MSHGMKLLLIATGTVMTCIVCFLSFSIVSGGRDQATAASQETQSVYQYDGMREYDGKRLTGRAVLELMKEYNGGMIYFLVKTKECCAQKGVFYNRNEDLDAAGIYNATQSPMNEDYINEAGWFDCSVIENENSVVVGIWLIQQ